MAKEKRRGKGEGSIAKETTIVNGKKYVAWRGRKTLDEIDPRTGKNRHIKTKKEVVDKLREIEMSMLTGTGNYHGECRMTMDQWFQEWLEKYMVNIKSSTRDSEYSYDSVDHFRICQSNTSHYTGSVCKKY